MGELFRGVCIVAERYPVVASSWVPFAYAAHMRRMTYAAYDICGLHMRHMRRISYARHVPVSIVFFFVDPIGHLQWFESGIWKSTQVSSDGVNIF